eukprot:454086-Hanusia_phi.AAC.5
MEFREENRWVDDLCTSSRYSHTIFVVDNFTSSGRCQELGAHNISVEGFRWGPDGKGIAAWSESGKKVWMWDVETGRYRVLEKQPGSFSSFSWGPDGKGIAATRKFQQLQLGTRREEDCRMVRVRGGRGVGCRDGEGSGAGGG